MKFRISFHPTFRQRDRKELLAKLDRWNGKHSRVNGSFVGVNSRIVSQKGHCATMAALRPLNGHRELMAIARITIGQTSVISNTSCYSCYSVLVLLFSVVFVRKSKSIVARPCYTDTLLVLLCATLIDKLYSVPSTEYSVPQSNTFQLCGRVLRNSLQFNVSHEVEWSGTKAAL